MNALIVKIARTAYYGEGRRCQEEGCSISGVPNCTYARLVERRWRSTHSGVACLPMRHAMLRAACISWGGEALPKGGLYHLRCTELHVCVPGRTEMVKHSSWQRLPPPRTMQCWVPPAAAGLEDLNSMWIAITL
jgi:hypothetical protein